MSFCLEPLYFAMLERHWNANYCAVLWKQ